MTVKIVTDSTADLPPDLAESLGISVIPLNVHFGTDVFKDGIDIKPDEFYQRLTSGAQLPTTSQPNVGEFLSLYNDLAKSNEEIVSVHISDKLSGTLNSARQAKDQYEGSTRIETIDSKHGSMGLGLIAVQASKVAKNGGSVDDVVNAINLSIDSVKFFALLDTLEYLQKGGRIGKARAFMGNLLKLKPILSTKGGEVFPFERARSRIKGVDRIFSLVQEALPISDLAVFYSTTKSEAEDLAAKLNPFMTSGEIIMSQIGPVVGTHAGPGVLGVAFNSQNVV
ncbi:MAG: DegV family protein [SAR202 cluster bacterium]|nr:DegV family protein [SAR202 cluster bacterium]|tara:strand:+ start:5607 stop:6452 length:846 start_codon:yes stop_codon:yes gene_type:complete